MQNVLLIIAFVAIGAIMVTVVSALLVFALDHGRRQAKELNDTYARLAQEFAGTLEPGGLMRHPKLRFTHQGAHVLLDVYSTGGENSSDYSKVQINWPDRTLRCEVCPAGFFQRMGKFLGVEDIQIGSAKFDEEYQISGNDPEAIRRLLTPGVQAAINELRRHTFSRDLNVSFRFGMLHVKKLELLRSFDKLATFVRLALALYDQVLLTSGPGIEFIEQPPPALGPPICQICGDEITSHLVTCRSCRTPHHHDCWQYYGACSTYGCRETKFADSRGGISASEAMSHTSRRSSGG